MLTSLRSLLHRRLPSISRLPQIDGSRVSSPINLFSTSGFGKDDGDDAWDKAWNGGDRPQDPTSGLDWGDVSSWSTGLTKEHFDGEAIGRPMAQDPQSQPQPQPEQPRSSAREMAIAMDEEVEMVRMLENDNKENKKFVDGWHDRMTETYKLLKQVREPGARGEYLKDSEKAEMYRLHKENPEVYTVEKLAKDYRVMRQRVHAILWLKEMEEEEEKKLGKPLDDSVEILLDNFPE